MYRAATYIALTAALAVLLAPVIPGSSDVPVWLAAGFLFVTRMLTKNSSSRMRFGLSVMAVIVGLGSSLVFYQFELKAAAWIAKPVLAEGESKQVDLAGQDGWVRFDGERYWFYANKDPELGCGLEPVESGFKSICANRVFDWQGRSSAAPYDLQRFELHVERNRLIR